MSSLAHHQRKPHVHTYTDSSDGLTTLSAHMVASGSEKAADATFTKDVKGDQQNLRYASLEQSSIPKYRVVGYGNIIGLNRSFKFHNFDNKRREVIRTGADSSRRSKKDSLVSSTVSKPPRQFRPDPSEYQDGASADGFIPLIAKRRKLSAHDASGDDRVEDSQGLSFEASSSDEERSNLSAHEDTFEAFRNDPVQIRQRDLSDKVARDPQDMSSWLHLIDMQHEVVASEQGRTASTQARAVAELRLSLYEKAKSRIKNSYDSEQLIRGLMQEASKVWDAVKLQQEWTKHLNNNSSFNLWVLYLDFIQSNVRNFTYERCLQCYEQCLAACSSKPTSAERDKHIIYLLLRLTRFMQNSGFSERAIAVWQGLLEFNFFTPEMDDPDRLLASFESFWDGELARIGEDGSRGWSSDGNLEVRQLNDSSKPQLGSEDSIVDWASREVSATNSAMTPARTEADSAEDDPHRVVLFSDIRPFVVFRFEESSLQLLIDAFLVFVGLPLRYNCPGDISWNLDAFLSTPSSKSTTQDDMESALSTNEFLTLLPVNAWVDCSTLFANKSTPSFLSAFPTEWHSLTTLSKWSTKVLRQLVDQRPQDDLLAEYVVALELQVSPKSARKYVKALLKARPSSYSLYNTYAMVECRLGNVDVAEKVWSTALSMMQGIDHTMISQKLFLLQSWIWTCLHSGDTDKAKRLLAHIPTHPFDPTPLDMPVLAADVPKDSMVMLRVEQYLQTYRSQALTFKNTTELAACTDLISLLHYYHENSNLQAAMRVYNDSIEQIRIRLPVSAAKGTNNGSLEYLHQKRSQFLQYHVFTRRAPYRPIDAIDTLTESQNLFPNNTVILALFHIFRQKAGIIDRLRAPLAALTMGDASPGTIITYMYNIADELARPSYAGSTEHTIRSAFSAALDSTSPVRVSIAIHMALIAWEAQIQQSKDDIEQKLGPRKQAKELRLKRVVAAYHTAVNACPWSKEITMMAFTNRTLRKTFSNQELQHVYNSMVERGLRIHVDLEEQPHSR